MKVTGNRRWWAAAALALSGMIIGIDGTVLSLALPTLATDLHASTSELQWFVDAYLLALGAMMLPAGLLGDRFGRKKLLLGALALFGIGSLACAYASTSGQLIAARVLLGLAAAFVVPLSISVLPVMFGEHERQRAIAVVFSAAMIAYPVGPILGGWLLTNYWWGSVFLINIPAIALAMLAVALLMPESRSETRPGLDLAGMLLSTVGLVALSYGLIEAGERGWGDVRSIAFILAGLAVLAGFVAWERRLTLAIRQASLGSASVGGQAPAGSASVAGQAPAGSASVAGGRQPLIDLDLFRSGDFTWGTVLSTLLSFALIGLLFAVPQYFRAVLGYDAMDTGLRLLPLIGGLIVGIGTGDRISKLGGARVAVALGFAVVTGGLVIAAFTGTGDGTGYAATWLAIGGFGFGVALPPTMNAALSKLTGERSGVGSAVIQAVRQVGATFGVALLGSVLNSAYRDRVHLSGLPTQVSAAIHDGVSSGAPAAAQLGSAELLAMVRSAFIHGMDVMLAVSAGITVAAAVLALIFLPGRSARRPELPEAAREAEEVEEVTRTIV
jgi:DHA2 family multidrug resistance protein-like MFS transporter